MRAAALVVLAACWGVTAPAPPRPPRPPPRQPTAAYVPHRHGAPPLPRTELDLVLSRLSDARDAVCACPDSACTTPIVEEVMRWGQEWQREHDLAMFDEADKAQIVEVVERLEHCMSQIGRGSSPTP